MLKLLDCSVSVAVVAQEHPEIRFSGVAGNSGSDTLLQGTTLSL